MNKKYLVRLTADARQELLQLTRRGKAAAYTIKQAHLLLQVEANGPHWADAPVAQALHCHGNTVRNVRQHFVDQGLEAALVRKKPGHPSRQRLLDGATAAHVSALRCSQPPAGQAKWTWKLLADTLVACEVVEPISYETVRQTLKKTRASHICTRVG
jgi:Homeodomain-like domain